MPEKKEYHKRILYLGLDPSRYSTRAEIVHVPIIKTVPRPFEEVEKVFLQLPSFTHLLFTSRTPIPICVDYAKRAGFSLAGKSIVVLGRATAEQLTDFGLDADHIAQEPCAEGVVDLLKTLDLRDSDLFFPHSALARRVIPDFLEASEIQHTALPLYETVTNRIEIPDLDSFDEIVFTSPSTVQAFRELFSTLPPREKCRAIGWVTENHFNF